MSLIPKKGTVYVVDDDEAVRDSLQWLLEGKDYRVKCFDSSESFLSRFDPREVACLIADIRMDGMSGLELQDRLLERKSPLPVVFITGHGDVPMAVTTMKKGAMDFIEKPFKEEELLGLVERLLRVDVLGEDPLDLGQHDLADDRGLRLVALDDGVLRLGAVQRDGEDTRTGLDLENRISHGHVNSVRSGSFSPRTTARSTSTHAMPRDSASTLACGLICWAASTPRQSAIAGSRRMRSR